MTLGEKCKKCNSKLESWESEYLTIDLSKILEENYKINFMIKLKSQICCDNARFPFIIRKFSDTMSQTMTKKGQDTLSLADIEEQLDMCKEVTEARHAYCANFKK